MGDVTMNDVIIKPSKPSNYHVARYGPNTLLLTPYGIERVRYIDKNKNGTLDDGDDVIIYRYSKDRCPQYARAIKTKGRLDEGLPKRCIEKKKLTRSEVKKLLQKMTAFDKKFVSGIFRVPPQISTDLRKYKLVKRTFIPCSKFYLHFERQDGLYKEILIIFDLDNNGIFDENDSIEYDRSYAFPIIESGRLSAYGLEDEKKALRKFVRRFSKRDRKFIGKELTKFRKQCIWNWRFPDPHIRFGRSKYVEFGLRLFLLPEYTTTWNKDTSSALQRTDGAGADVGIGLHLDLPYIPNFDIITGSAIGAHITNANGKTTARAEYKPYVGLNFDVILKSWKYKAVLRMLFKGGYKASIMKNDQGKHDARNGGFAGIGFKLNAMSLMRYFHPQLNITYSHFPSKGELSRRHDLSLSVGLEY